MKRTTEEVASYFRQHGCELLDEYLGCMEPMEYRCSCGNISYITWNNFTKGKRCGHCAKTGPKKKRSLEEVRRMFQERGCEFLDQEFRGVHYKHRYRCKCGREAEITFAAFHHQHQYCRECGRQKNKGSGNPAWVADREKLKLKQQFRKKCYKMLQSSLAAVGKQKVGHTSDMLGYSPKELQERIVNHPNWTRVKDGNWHLDHVFPIEAFVEHGITDIRLINNLDNLQPLSQPENNIKHAKYNKKKFLRWLANHEAITP
jgi:hypothetical protein